MDSSDDDFDMLPVKRRGAPVVAKIPNGLDNGVHMKINTDLSNGLDDNDIDLLPVKPRSGPKNNFDIDADDPFGLPKINSSGTNGTSSDILNGSSCNDNGLYNDHFNNVKNGLSFHDLNKDDNADLDALPVKPRGASPKVNGESFGRHRGDNRIIESEDPFDNISMQVRDSPILHVNNESDDPIEAKFRTADTNGLTDVLQNEMLYNPLVNVFDRLGLKNDSPKKEIEKEIVEVKKLDFDIFGSVDVLRNTNTNNIETTPQDDFQVCQDPAPRKPKGVSFDLDADLNKLPENVNQDFSIPQQNSSQQDFGNNFEEQFQPIESSDFINGLDFLEQCGGNTEAMEELQRKSLYVRFDPLCETQGDIKPKPPKKENNDKTAVVPDIKPVIEDSLFDNVETKPVINDVPKEKLLPDFNDPFSPVKQRGPLKADNELKEVYPVVNPIMNDPGLVEPLLYTQSDMDEVIKKAKLDLDDDVHAREMDWKKKYEELENKIKEEVAMRELIEQDYRSKIDCLRKDNTDMKQVVVQYERTIVELTENTHRDHKSNEDTLAETIRAKEQLQYDLNSAEQTIFDTLKRVEKLKQSVDGFKQNEDKLRSNNNECHQKLSKSEERYEKLKEHVTKKIDDANVLISKERKQKEVDLAGLQAALKKATNKANNLELEIQQKNIENQQLSQICDDLIKKVSGE